MHRFITSEFSRSDYPRKPEKTALWRLAVWSVALLSAATFAPSAYGDGVVLDFATANQSLWSAGGATILDARASLPDPALSGTATIPQFSMDPTGAILDFLGLGDILPSIKVRPVLDYHAGLNASYHINSGSINVNYPTALILDLPTQIKSGHTFDVGLSEPGGIFTVPQFASSTIEGLPQQSAPLVGRRQSLACKSSVTISGFYVRRNNDCGRRFGSGSIRLDA